MENPHLVCEISRHQPQQLRGQGNFRHQQQGAFPPLQAGTDQLDIHGGFSRAGHPLQQGNPGLFRLHLGQKALITSLLLRVQHQRPVENRRTDLPAAQHRPVRQGQISQLFQPVHRTHSRSGVVAQFFYRRGTQAAKQLQHRFLHGRRLGSAGGVGHSLLRRNRQGGNLLGFISQTAKIVRLSGNPFFPGQISQNGFQFLLRKGPFQGSGFRLSSRLFQQFQNLPGAFLANHGLLPGPVLRQTHRHPLPEPHAPGQHGPNGVVKGAEIPFPKKSRQPELPVGKDGLRVQKSGHFLQFPVVSGGNSQNHPFSGSVPPAKGQLNPLSRLNGHSLRNPVGIGLVYGKRSRGHGNLDNHPHPLAFLRKFRISSCKCP